MEEGDKKKPELPGYLQPAVNGARKGLQTTFRMSKIIFPVTFVLILLEKTGWLPAVAGVFRPFLGVVGLPGEAALPLFLGFISNIYAAMGAIAVLSLSPREITLIALIILTCHSLMMEGPVLKIAGLSPLVSVPLRLLSGLFFALLLNLIYLGLGG